MSGRLSGLKASLKADRDPPPAAAITLAKEDPAPRKSTRAKARENKRAVVGYYSPELQRALNVMAVERDTTLQAILGEAIDLWLREQGKHPFGER
jgi:hypothetical protein